MLNYRQTPYIWVQFDFLKGHFRTAISNNKLNNSRSWHWVPFRSHFYLYVVKFRRAELRIHAQSALRSKWSSQLCEFCSAFGFYLCRWLCTSGFVRNWRISFQILVSQIDFKNSQVAIANKMYAFLYEKFLNLNYLLLILDAVIICI